MRPNSNATDTIARRYRVEGALAHGGMGEVLEVFDTRTQRRVALKRMLNATDTRLRSMFEREYHTLVALRHPRIIEAYEYGVDNGQPYYTMELLDGQDLRQLTNVPYRTACRYLRDIASSLALLHARRLLHRDLSPRNVRVTSDDRCKLLDFGALASFGLSDTIVGTPPFMAPESVQRVHLDQRSDLYALGAVGYWLLTGRHAFPAHTMQELPQMWTSVPMAPSACSRSNAASDGAVLELIPPALDELVLSLISPNPLARPSSAAEVIARLDVIGQLEPEPQELSARSYLHGARLVGREREQARLHKRLTAAIAGTGSSMLISASAGMGASRLIGELAVAAQLGGATCAFVNALQHRGVYGVANAIVDKLFELLPDESAQAAMAFVAALAHVSPRFAALRATDQPAEALPAGELRRRTQDSLAEWLRAISRKRPLLLMVDDAQRADEGSAALLATLARTAREYPMMVVVACDPNEASASPAALRAIEEAGASMQLRRLAREDVETLVRAIFGEVAHTGKLASWLHPVSAGSPQACMDLIHHLVDHQVIRFIDNMWVIPQEISHPALPASVDQALQARISALSADAQKLAQALSVHRGQVPIERCSAMAEEEGVTGALAALGELVSNEILVQQGAGYHFKQDLVRERLYAGISDERKRRLHRQMGRVLLASEALEVNARLDAGWHLLNGGDETQGADLLAQAGIELCYQNDELAAAVPALQAALGVFRKEQRRSHDLILLLGPLAIAGYRVDRRLAIEYGDETVELLRTLIGLRTAEALRPFLGARLSLYLGLGSAALRSIFVRGRGGAAGLQRLITMFFTTIISLAGAATICFDVERARRYANAIAPMRELGRDHIASLACDFVDLLTRLPEDRIAEVAQGCERVAARFESPVPIKGATSDSRVLIVGAIYYALGAMNCFRDAPRALECAERLDAMGMKLYAMAADQLRTIHHALRGEIGIANRFRERVETHAIQAGTGWQVEVWQPAALNLVYLNSADVIGQKSVADQTERLQQEIPTFRRHSLMARASFWALKGDHQQAYDLRRVFLDSAPARSFIGWPATLGAQALSALAIGRPQEALAIAKQVIDRMSEADAVYVRMYQVPLVALCMAETALGSGASAAARLDALIAKHTLDQSPLTLGSFHCARAEVAMLMGELDAAKHHHAEMERWFRGTENPALIAQCERLGRQLRLHAGAAGEDAMPATTGADELRSLEESVRSVLSQCAGPEQRGERALELLLHHLHAREGYLFTHQPESHALTLIAPQHGTDPPSALQEHLLRVIAEAEAVSDDATALVANIPTESERTKSHVQVGEQSYRAVLLTMQHDGVQTVVAAAAVRETGEGARPARQQVLQLLATTLYESGDAERVHEPMEATVARAVVRRR
ncbi:MAG TPA: protein kinase [Polyangiales bacterium]